MVPFGSVVKEVYKILTMRDWKKTDGTLGNLQGLIVIQRVIGKRNRLR